MPLSPDPNFDRLKMMYGQDIRRLLEDIASRTNDLLTRADFDLLETPTPEQFHGLLEDIDKLWATLYDMFGE
jgi:hypothetical protein